MSEDSFSSGPNRVFDPIFPPHLRAGLRIGVSGPPPPAPDEICHVPHVWLSFPVVLEDLLKLQSSPPRS